GFAVYNFAGYLLRSSGTKTVPVVFAVSEIPANTRITEDMLEIRQVPSGTENPKSYSDTNKIKGAITNSSIEAGEQVLSPRLNRKGNEEGGLSYIIPDGKRAITIEATSVSSVGGFLKAGDFADIIAAMTVSEKTERGEVATVNKGFMLLQNIEVLKTGAGGSGAAGNTNVTVAVEPEDAVKLFYAANFGRLTFALRPALDKSTRNIPAYKPGAQG
ncbi:MAG: Flp pilus assembly protein CpaB, partial [Bacillota bacterium]|nr:Flp pilus assembly protein CpaB [Bacillota bacterium]